MATPLRAVAQALEWPFKESGRVELGVRVHMVADSSSSDTAMPLAVLAQWMLSKLGLAKLPPAHCLVELPIPLCLWTASIPLALPGLEGNKLRQSIPLQICHSIRLHGLKSTAIYALPALCLVFLVFPVFLVLCAGLVTNARNPTRWFTILRANHCASMLPEKEATMAFNQNNSRSKLTVLVEVSVLVVGIFTVIGVGRTMGWW